MFVALSDTLLSKLKKLFSSNHNGRKVHCLVESTRTFSMRTFLKLFFLQTFRTIAEGDRFVTLVLVKRISGNFNNSPAEWIWSDPFHWLSYEMAEQRCVHWYDKQPDPEIYTGKSQNSPFLISTGSQEARQKTFS